MKIFKELKNYKDLFPYAKGVGLGVLLTVNVLRLITVLLLPAFLWAGHLYASVALCLCYAALFVLTNSVSVKAFTKLHIFPRIAMTKKVLYKKAPELDLRQQIEGNVASTRGLIEEGLFDMVLGAVFFVLSLLFALYFAWPVGLCALLGLFLLLPDRHRKPSGGEKAFFERALLDTENAESKLSEFSALPRQKMRVYRIEWTVLLRLAAFAAACVSGTGALLAYVYFEFSVYFLSLYKKGKNEAGRQLHQLEQISDFLKADWPDAK